MIGIHNWLLAWALVATQLLIAWSIGAMWQDGSRQLRKALIGALVLLAVVIAAWSAFAHDHSKPLLNETPRANLLDIDRAVDRLKDDLKKQVRT
jgi:hypothetical protein